MNSGFHLSSHGREGVVFHLVDGEHGLLFCTLFDVHGIMQRAACEAPCCSP